MGRAKTLKSDVEASRFNKALATAYDRLQTLSRAGKPSHKIRVGGRLKDAALGAIYVAEVEKLEGPTILKTLDLKDQNVWAVTKHNKKTTVRGLDTSNIVALFDRKSEAHEYLQTWCKPIPSEENNVVAKVAFANGGLISRDGATRLACLNEYLNESLVGHVITEVLQNFPHFVKTYDTWIQDATGFILQDHGGQTLGDHMCELSLEEFQSAVLQVLVAISVANEVINLKHHDVHLDNVFVTRMRSDDPRRTSEYFTYRLKGPYGPYTFKIKHHGILARLGDFGLASVTDPRIKVRYERIDYRLLDAGDYEWGEWSGQLEGRESYDLVTFLSKFFLEDELAKCPKAHAKWAQSLWASLTSLDPNIQCSVIGRPHRGREGRVKGLTWLSGHTFAANLDTSDIGGGFVLAPLVVGPGGAAAGAAAAAGAGAPTPSVTWSMPGV